MPKISQLPSDTAPAASDYVSGVQASVPGTVRFLLSSLATFFWTLANIPSGATSPITRDNESQFAFVASGLVWSGDAYASTKNASMTAGVCYINGRRISVSAVTARTFSASLDTYIDILDNGDGTGTLVYTTASNNAASPVLAASSIRIGIIQVGVSSIAAAGSVNQGQESKVLPIASSIPYQVTDSLGNLICPRDPASKVLGYRQLVANATVASVSDTQITGLTVPVIVPTNRKIKVSFFSGFNSQTNASDASMKLWDGAVGATVIQFAKASFVAGLSSIILNLDTTVTPTSASKTYNISAAASVGTLTINAGAGTSPYIKVELA